MDNHTPTLRPGTINPDPRYKRPDRYKRKMPAFLARLLESMGETDLTAHPAFYMPSTGRKRTIRKHGRNSLNATLRTLIANADVITASTTISCTSMAAQCGLQTKSAAGNKGITRFTRALKVLDAAGATQSRIERDPSSGQFLSAVVVITAVGMAICGTTEKAWRAAARMRANFSGKPLAYGDEEETDLKQRLAERVAAWRKMQRERRAEKARRKREETLARRAARKEEERQLHSLMHSLTQSLPLSELKELGLDGLKKRALSLLRRVSSPPVPE